MPQVLNNNQIAHLKRTCSEGWTQSPAELRALFYTVEQLKKTAGCYRRAILLFVEHPRTTKSVLEELCDEIRKNDLLDTAPLQLSGPAGSAYIILKRDVVAQKTLRFHSDDGGRLLLDVDAHGACVAMQVLDLGDESRAPDAKEADDAAAE